MRSHPTAGLEPQRHDLAVEDRGGRLRRLLGDLVRGLCVGDRVGELEPCLRVSRLEPQALVQACVLERYGRVPGQHLEQPQVTLVELPDAKLRQEDDARDAGAVAERHGDHGLVHLFRAGDLDRELAPSAFAASTGRPASATYSGDTRPDLDPQGLNLLLLGDTVALHGDGEHRRRPRGRRDNCGSRSARAARSRSPRRCPSRCLAG